MAEAVSRDKQGYFLHHTGITNDVLLDQGRYDLADRMFNFATSYRKSA